MQQVHGLAIRMSAHNDVPNVVDHASQLQAGGLTREVLVLEELAVRHQIASVSYDKHVADVGIARRGNLI